MKPSGFTIIIIIIISAYAAKAGDITAITCCTAFCFAMRDALMLTVFTGVSGNDAVQASRGRQVRHAGVPTELGSLPTVATAVRADSIL